MKIEFCNQWKQSALVDLVQIGFYHQQYLFSICITLLGFGIDLDFVRKRDSED